jgi:hypothetical protein
MPKWRNLPGAVRSLASHLGIARSEAAFYFSHNPPHESKIVANLDHFNRPAGRFDEIADASSLERLSYCSEKRQKMLVFAQSSVITGYCSAARHNTQLHGTRHSGANAWEAVDELWKIEQDKGQLRSKPDMLEISTINF